MALVRIAQVLRSHGLKGELKLSPLNPYLDEIDENAECVLESKFGKQQNVHIEKVRIGNDVIVKFREINSKTEADVWNQGFLLADEENLPELPEDTFYVKDLLGLKVVTEEGVKVGEISDVIETPAHDVYEIKTSAGKKMIPAVEEFVREINMDERKIVIHIIPGLLE